MRKPDRETLEYLKGVSWAVFLLLLFLAGLTLVFGRQVGYVTMAWVSLGFGLLLSAVFAAIVGLNLMVVLLCRFFKRLRRRNGA